MDQSNLPGNRRTRRAQVDVPAIVEVCGASLPVTLRNLSQDGALIEAERPPVEGSQVLFRRNALSVRGRIVWVDGRHAGIAFGCSLSAEDVLRNVPRPKYRVHLEARRYSPDGVDHAGREERVVENWLGSLTFSRE